MDRGGVHSTATAAVGDGWVAGGNFFTSIMAGFVLGFVADRLLGIEPWLTVIGIIVGSIWGFYKMWLWLKEETARGR